MDSLSLEPMPDEEACQECIPFSASHLDAVARIETAEGDVRWSRAQFEKESAANPVRFYVLTRPGSDLKSGQHMKNVRLSDLTPGVVGYGGYWKAADEAQITNLVIRRDARRRGLGRKMLEHILRKAKDEGCLRCTLEVRAGNAAAKRLYAAAGFRETGIRPALYRDPVDDAILMEKLL